MIRSVAWVVLVVAVFLATTAFRFLNLKNGFPDDHYVHLAGGWQMTFGEWPTRDFVDPGLPAMFAASAAAQWLLGETLYSEVVLVAVAFAAAAAFTMLAVRQLTGSMILALLAAIAEVAIVPRTYGYPKLLLYAVGFWLMTRYAVRPTIARAATMAAVVVIAFLFRHDHGLFLGIGGLLVAALSTKERSVHAVLRSSGIFAALVAVCLLPYVIFIEAYMGLGLYIRTGIEFSRAEAARQGHVWPSLFGENRLQAALLYECYLIPLIALTVVALDRRREVIAQIVPIAVVALMVDFGFIREPLGTRLPDAIVPLVVLGAWLIGRAWAPGGTDSSPFRCQSRRSSSWAHRSCVRAAPSKSSIARRCSRRGARSRGALANAPSNTGRASRITSFPVGKSCGWCRSSTISIAVRPGPIDC